MRLAVLICSGLLAALPAAGQTILGVLGGSAVGTDDAGAVVTIDPTTGAATVLGTPIAGESLTGVARLNDGRVLASTAKKLAGKRWMKALISAGLSLLRRRFQMSTSVSSRLR